MRGDNVKCYTAAHIIKDTREATPGYFLLIIYVEWVRLTAATGAAPLSFQGIVDNVQTVWLDVLGHALQI